MLRILVGDDQPDVLESLRLLFKGAGHETQLAGSPAALLAAAQSAEFDLILMDMNYARDTTSGEEGLDLLARLHAMEICPPIVVMTAWSTVTLAVEAMQRGAVDFVQKPWDNQKLLDAIERHSAAAARARHAERQARTELEIAHSVQQKLFPEPERRLSNLEYGGRCLPARAVGGDYYDYIDLGEGRLGFVLADVSGKGIAAALLMAGLQASFRGQCALGLRHPDTLLASVNRLFCESTLPQDFATAVFGVYDEATRLFTYVNCGHPAPLLVRKTGEVEKLPTTASILGVFHNWQCRTGTVRLDPGDTLLLFSDGVLEAGMDDGHALGEEGLLAVALAGRSLPLDGLVSAVVARAGEAGQTDDLTVVALRGM